MKNCLSALLFSLLCSLPALAVGPADPPAYDCNNDTQNGPPTCPALGANPVNSGTGNLYREVTDISTFGAAPVSFQRNFNSRTTTFNTQYSDFGATQTWQHNWNFEMRQLTSKTFGFFDIKVRYPNGREYNFKATDSSGQQLAPSADWGDRLYRWSGNQVGYTLIKPDGMEYSFLRYLSPRFDLKEVRNGHGLVFTLTHDANHKVKRITNPFGKWLEITRSTVNGIECVTQVSTSDGRSVTYAYTAYAPTSSSVLTSVTYPGGSAAVYSWTGASSTTTGRPLLSTASDPMYRGAGARMKYLWNYNQIFNFGGTPTLVTGTILEERNLDSDKTIVSLPYGAGTNPVIVEGNGTPIGRMYEKGQMTKIWDGEGRLTTRTYTASGWGYLASSAEPNGGTTSYTRDYAGRPLTITDALGATQIWTYNTAGFEVSFTDKRGFTTTTTRDAFNRPTRIDYPDGSYETWTYNTFGYPLTHRLRSGGIESMIYGSDGNVATRTDAAGAIWQYAYDTAGRVTSMTNPRSHTTSYTYNWRGDVVNIAHPDSSSLQFTYDAFGNLTTKTNELGKTWSYTYNSYQRIESETDPLSRTTAYEYGREPGCSTCTFADTLSRVTLPSGKKIEYEYDRSWKRTATIAAPGSADEARTTYTYDTSGNLVSTTNPRGKMTTYAYDLLSRKTSEVDPVGSTTSWTYDAADNVLVTTYADATTSSATYDAMNRPLTSTDALNQTTTFTYHPDGSMASLTDARSSTYTFTVDNLSRRTRMTYPGGSYEAWTYDGNSNMTQYRTRSGVTMTCTLDNRNRDTFCNWSDTTPDVTKTYDAAGRLLTLANSVSTLTYAYDPADQLLSEHSAFPIANFAFTVSYTYDVDGNRATFTDPTGAVIAYAYTGRNQVASIVADGPPPIATFTYDAAGNRVSRSLENGILSTYNFDNANRLTSIVHGSSVETLSYTYNNMNRRTSETRTSGGLRSFGYDSTGQLTQVTHSGGNATFSYDAVGNRLNVTGAPGAGTYAANALNQYTTAGGVGALTYDANGNLATGGGWTYDHNGDSRLTAVTGSANATFERDARNRTVKRTENGVTTYLVYDGWSLVAEYNTANVTTAHYINGPRIDEILAKVTPTSTTLPLEDALGSTIGVTSDTGTVLERIFYTDAFGTPSFQDASGNPLAGSSTGTRFLFTGREWLATLALYDYRNRTYSPSLGRFIEADPIRFKAGDVNLYRYVSNDPISLVDDDGKMARPPGQQPGPPSGPPMAVQRNCTQQEQLNCIDHCTKKGSGYYMESCFVIITQERLPGAVRVVETVFCGCSCEDKG